MNMQCERCSVVSRSFERKNPSPVNELWGKIASSRKVSNLPVADTWSVSSGHSIDSAQPQELQMETLNRKHDKSVVRDEEAIKTGEWRQSARVNYARFRECDGQKYHTHETVGRTTSCLAFSYHHQVSIQHHSTWYSRCPAWQAVRIRVVGQASLYVISPKFQKRLLPNGGNSQSYEGTP